MIVEEISIFFYHHKENSNTTSKMSGEEEKRELGKEMIGTTIEIDGDIPFEVREKLKNKSVFENETCFLYRNARGCSLQAWSQKVCGGGENLLWRRGKERKGKE